MSSSKKTRNSDFFIGTLKLAMKKFDLNQPQLAKKTAISSGLISDYLNGKSEPGYSNIEKIAIGLGLSVSRFFALGEECETGETPTQAAPPVTTGADLEKELLLENRELRKEIEALKRTLYPPTSSDTDATEIALHAGTPDGSNILVSNREKM